MRVLNRWRDSQLTIGYYYRWLPLADQLTIFDNDEGWDLLPRAIKTLLRSIYQEIQYLWCWPGSRLRSHSKTYVTYEIMVSHAWIRSTTYTRSFPDHSEKSASAIIMRILRRFPGVLNKAVQPILDATFLSKSIAALISSNSYCTRGSLLYASGVKSINIKWYIINARIPVSMMVSQRLESLVFPKFGWSMGGNNCKCNEELYRPLLTSQRGDSGTNQIKNIWITEGKPCMAEGIRHAQLLEIRKVPKVYNSYWTM